MIRSSNRSSATLFSALLAASVAGLAANPSLGQILSIHGSSLTTYNGGASAVQKANPRAEQRATLIDGQWRAGAWSPWGWSIAGNTGSGGHGGAARIGDVSLDTGTYAPTVIDLSLPARRPWIVGRTYNARQTAWSNGPQGYGWFQTSMPEITFYDADSSSGTKGADDMVYVFFGSDRFAEFKRSADNSDIFQGRNGANGLIEYASGSPDTWTLTDQAGNVTVFFGSNTSLPGAAWQLWKTSDPAGNTAYVGDSGSASGAVTSGFDSSGRLIKGYDSEGRAFIYSYDGNSRITEIKVQVSGSDTGQSVAYSYYGASEDHGVTGDLKQVTITTPLSPTGVSDVRRQYYRYWKNADAQGDDHQVKLVLGYEGARRYDWLDSNLTNASYATQTDATLKPYAEVYMEYDGSGRVSKATFGGECGCSSASNNGEHVFDYQTNSSYSNNSSSYDTAWARRTVVTLPDDDMGTTSNNPRLVQYFDEVGQSLSTVRSDRDPVSTTPAPKFEVTEVVRDSSGRVSTIYSPATNSGHTHGSSSATFGHTASGLVRTFARFNSTDDPNHTSIHGFVKHEKWQDGSSGTAYYLTSYDYIADNDGTGKLFKDTKSSVDLFRPNLSKIYRYPTATTTVHASDCETTDVDTTPVGPTAKLTTKETTQKPKAVSSGNGGSGSQNESKSAYGLDGRMTFSKTPLGVVSYRGYSGGQLVTSIEDADTTQTGSGQDFNGVTIPSGFSTGGSGTASHVKTTYTYDSQGRLDTVGRPATAGGTLTSKSYYTRLSDGRLVTLSIPRVVSGSTYYGPVSYSVSNHAGKVEFQGTIAISSSGTTTALSSWINTAGNDPITALSSSAGTLARMSTTTYNEPGVRATASQSYFSIPASGIGTLGTHYDESTMFYDNAGRMVRSVNAAGTINRTVYDVFGRPTQHWVGTNDYEGSTKSRFLDPAQSASGTFNMSQLDAVAYDDTNTVVKNSLVTSRTAYVQVNSDGTGNSTGERVTSYSYDVHNRAYLVVGPQTPYSATRYDNLGRVVASAQYTSSSGITASTDISAASSSNRVSLSTSLYDENGRVWQSRTYEINQSTGAIVTTGSPATDVYLPSLTTFDEQGRVIRTRGTSLSKTVYDRLGRVLDRYTLAKDNDTSYADASTVSGDTVLEESHTYYQDSTGLPLFTHSVQRNFDDSTTTGALDSNADAATATITASNVKGRLSITAFYYDAWHRQTDVAAYGTHGLAGDGTGSSTFTRASGVPGRSDTILVSSSTHDTDGTVQQTTDPRGLITRTLYDQAGRKIADIRNYTGGSTTTATRDNDVFTRYTYSAGRMTEMWVDLDGDNTKDGDDQVTTYTYGITKGASAGDSKISSNDLLWKVTYPDSASGTDLVSFAYNAQGQEIYKKDQAGNVLETDYDTAGRKTATRATTVISGFDGTVKRIALSYLSRGLVDKVTQYDAATSGTALNEVGYEYDNWGNITKFLQDRDGLIGTGGGHNEAQVAFAYSAVTTSDGSGRAGIRRTSMTNPKTLGASDGASITYTFGSGGNLDEVFGRVSQVSVAGTAVTDYQYQGAGTLVTTSLKTATADTSYRMHSGSSGSGFSGYLDNFGRVTRSQWKKLLGTPFTLYDMTLTYDRDGNITSADDAVTASGSGYDAKYSMDSLNRLIDVDEGTLASGNITSRTRRERWDENSSGLGLDQVGNWNRRKLDLDGDGVYTGTGELNDTGVFNAANEWQTRDTDSNSSTNYTLTHDAVGNMTDDGKDYTYVHDVFGRIVTAKARGSGNPVAEYGYDGLGQRIFYHADEDADGTVESSNDDPKYNFVYDDRWRIIATYRVPYSGTVDSTPKETFVWHAAGVDGRGGSSYIDSVILRDRQSGSWTAAASGTLDERRFYLQNWRADVSALCDTRGRPVERIKYSAYGTPTNFAGADFNMSGGAIDPDDLGDFLNAYYASPADPTADWNLDGSIDPDDLGDYINDEDEQDDYTPGRGQLSMTLNGNRIGYAGYIYDRFISGSDGGKWHVRHRVLDSGLGRWTRRDPLGYVDGMGLYEYVTARPMNRRDPSGLVSWPECLGKSTEEECKTCCDSVLESDRERCRRACYVVHRDPRTSPGGMLCELPSRPGMTLEDACNAIRTSGCGFSPGELGTIVCFEGRARICNYAPRGDIIAAWQRECMDVHEQVHANAADCSDCPAGRVCSPAFKKGVREGAEECLAYYREIECLKGKCPLVANLHATSGMPCDEALTKLNKLIEARCERMTHYCGQRPAASTCRCAVACM